MDVQQQIERYQRNDRLVVDLYHKLKVDDLYRTKGSTAFSGLAEKDYYQHEQLGVPFFYQSWHHSFPQELIDQFKHMRSNFSTGLLPSIMRAWMSIDSDLYLWNFDNNRDLAYYDAINNTILRVAIVPPRTGFSLPSLHSILIVATTVDIVLLAIGFHDNSGNVLPPTSDDLKDATISMVGGAPLYRLPLDGLIVSDICPTLDGRIFFSADDSLFELEYFEKGWFGTGGTCKKTNHSKRLINYLVPVLQIFYAKESVFQLVVDDSRHLLYLLMKSGCIQVFDLGVDGRSIQKFGALYREQIEHLAKESCNVNPELFSEIVNISPIPLSQSINVNLVATTSKGVRIYISCLSTNLQLNEVSQKTLRPSALRILHIRFPPDIPLTSPHNLSIYTTYQTHDCTLMATPGPDSNSSIILAHSTSCFSHNPQLVEFICFNRIHGSVWSIAHSRQKSILKSRKEKEVVRHSDEFPLSIEQHLCPMEKFFVISSKGIYVFEHCSPLEIFRHILTQFGSDSKQFQGFEAVVSQIEMCVMALQVICSRNASDATIRDMALRVFFHCAGEPRLHYGGGDHFIDYGPRASTSSDGYMNGTLSSSVFTPKTPLRTSTPQNNSTPANYTNGFTPQHVLHTPGGGLDGDQSIIAGARVINSPRHEALFIYFSRIVKGIWRRNLCSVKQINEVISQLSKNELEEVGYYLNSLQQSIDEYSLISPQQTRHFPNRNLQQQRRTSSEESSVLDQERQSLQKLKILIGVTCEVIALWSVLLEHELRVIFVALAPDVQKCLINWSLDDLVRNRNEVCPDLISALIRHYIGDDASTAAISERLRSLCPTLFTVDDASVVKATENIYRAKTSTQPRLETIKEAVIQFKKSIQKLNLIQTCDLLLQVLYFDGIVDLSLMRARREDPNDLALIVYKKHLTPNDLAVQEAMEKRNEAYNCILEVLRILQTLAISTEHQLASINFNNFFQSGDSLKQQLSSTRAQEERDNFLRKILESNDELACVKVFHWMLANNLADQLITNKFKYFESFLFHEIEDGKGNIYLELLWKYYEKSHNYLEAAKVLAGMASKATSRTSINNRITDLSNALMCVQSAPETKTNLELKQEIQDKLDVAQIQMRAKTLLESDTSVEMAARGKEAIEALNYQLCGLTQLYNYAKTYNLHEIKLAVLHCASQFDAEIVQNVWRDILEKELCNFQLTRSILDTIQNNISSILLRLRKRYVSSPQFVPLDYILRELIVFSFKKSPPIDWILGICKGAEIKYNKLLSVASEQYRIYDPFWKQNQRAFNFMLDLALLTTERCMEEAKTLKSSDRKVLKNTCLEFLSALQLNVQDRMSFGIASTTQRSITERLELLNAQISKIS
ncbi:Nucleoporin_N domain-containing protein [Meloidogyne graminicola]|uniref:Nucleoporin_N domain-containing protein n=1 Tax=Meloidogyne graminicola TaxID=189291 RepID=A0A8T0A1Y0_9BILA|nr:Nucleoporin_N domain-containing protein [Meloidogyne graminicola]